MSQPRPVRSIAQLEGWTPETLVEQGLPAMAGSFHDLGATNSVFSWDPV
jgi:hypothetical protein